MILNKYCRRILLAIILILLLGIGVCQIYQNLDNKTPIEFSKSMDLAQYGCHDYRMEVRFAEDRMMLEVDQEVKYVNRHRTTFDTIYFHLYPNAFKDQEKVPFPGEELDLAYPQGFQPGYIELQDVTVDGIEVDYDLGGIHHSILAIHLNEGLEPLGTIPIKFTFQVKIPPIAGRFGYGENTINLGNWYPIAAVYDEKGWNLEPYYGIGDPFYSEVGNYYVTLQLPKKYILASTGDIVGEGRKNARERVYTVQAHGVRDFSWVISEDFLVKEESLGETLIKVYYFKGQQGEKGLEVAKDALAIFNRLFGEYPYQQFSVVSCDFYIGGMEFPNLVYIDQSIFSRESTMLLEYIIAHETAHQWWYGLVGNDQVNEPWIDEALTEYSTMLYYREKYGEDTMMDMLKIMVIDDYVRARNGMEGEEERIAKGVDEFRDSREYSGMVYSKGAMMFYELEREVGREDFQTILQYYLREHQFSNVTGRNIQEITRAVTGQDYDEFFDRWLEGND